MKRRSLPVAAAFAAAAALMLTACGSGDDTGDDNDRIAGAEQGSRKKASPTAEQSGAADRPSITFPKGVKNEFRNWRTGKPAEDAVLADVAQTVNAVDDAILKGEEDSATVAYYRQGKALLSAQKWIHAWLADDLTFTGVTRYFRPDVEVVDKDTAAVVYCADESKAVNKNRKTGKLDTSPSDESPFVTYSSQLKRNDKGVWQTTEIVSKRGEKTCAS
ncbi:hypothetical protein ABT112_30670 [Streptomyces sp. NPDC002055]|uniref:hypothetical protein n=1 Tax=Streptomyces sp. NPDC002055 TaxID=3154534 RepID=UPI0033206C4A